jgi:hypothetical protein
MQVPKTGKERVIAQIEKEKKWKRDAAAVTGNSSYEQAMMNRKNNGKRGRKKAKDYIDEVQMDEEQIAESIILNESNNETKKDKDPYSDLD